MRLLDSAFLFAAASCLAACGHGVEATTIRANALPDSDDVTEAPAAVGTPDVFAPIVSVGERRFLVLSSSASLLWGSRPELISRVMFDSLKATSNVPEIVPNESVAVADVEPAEIPRKFQRWLDRSVEVFDSTHSVGEGRVVSLHLMRRSQSFDSAYYWTVPGGTNTPTTDAEFVAEMWRGTGMKTLLVAELEMPVVVEGLTWGRAAERGRPEIEVYEPIDASASLHGVPLAELRTHGERSALAAALGALPEIHDPAALFSVVPLAESSRGARVVLVRVTVGEVSLDGDQLVANLLVHTDAHGRARSYELPPYEQVEYGAGYMDVDGDGVPEIVQSDRLLVLGPDGVRAVVDARPEVDIECGC